MKISVVMPVYNTAVSLLREAVESILNQTFRDFEFIIIDDGSTNGSDSYLKSIQDNRVKLIWNPINVGITKSLNIGFQAAKGKYIARMDSDDVSYPTRFEKQYAFMESYPDVFVCGTKAENYGEKPAFVKTEMEDMETYRIRMLFTNPGPVHPTAFFNRAKLLQHHILYDEELTYAQDYGMWMRISQLGRICVLPEVLLYHRIHSGQISSAHRKKQIQCDQKTQRILLEQLLGEVTQEELDLHYSISVGYKSEAIISPQTVEWLDRLTSANTNCHIYDQKLFKERITNIKKNLIYQTMRPNMSSMQKAMLFFRYLPIHEAVREVTEIIGNKAFSRRQGQTR